MRILNIKYHNYRCFRDLSLSFNTNGSKNIALVIAPNGGGKTEMLFSFWWVLYDFAFSKLKGKESTAYSLNSALYHELSTSLSDKKATCWVELEFEHEGTRYTIKRTETFSKTSQGITSSQQVALSNVLPNGESTVPIDDPEAVERKLSGIIPKKILSGIIFDGERMKQLSSEDEDSKNAVEGVIRHITNEELFEICKGQLEDIKSDVSKELRRIGRENNNTDIDSISVQIEREEETKRTEETQRDIKKEQLELTESELHDISLELSRHHDSKVYEEQRNNLRAEIAERNPKLETYIDTFYKDLLNGYFLISEKLLSDVTESVIQDKTPLGLTVEAVDSILAMPNCICGHPLTEREKENLKSLRSKLPPVNINSTVRQMIHYAEGDITDIRETIKRSYKEIQEEEKTINDRKQKIAQISSLITAGASEAIKDLEKRNNEAVVLKNTLVKEISIHERNIEEYTKRIAKHVEQRKSLSQAKGATSHLTSKDEYIRKCLDAIKAIDEFNKKVSLKKINEKINDAYSILSQDYEDGRRLYIIQYDKKEMYRMVSYLVTQYDELYNKYVDDGTLTTYKSLGKSDEEIKEIIIMKVRESSSTGQGKINSLAFAKSILDYSRETRDTESTELSRSYPFLIDSPFTELSDGNLAMSAENIHSFADQIILLISRKSYVGVQSSLEPYIATTYEIVRNAGESNSTIKED